MKRPFHLNYTFSPPPHKIFALTDHPTARFTLSELWPQVFDSCTNGVRPPNGVKSILKEHSCFNVSCAFTKHFFNLLQYLPSHYCNKNCANNIDMYSHLSINGRGWNKRGGGAKDAKSINVEFGINVEGGIFWKKLVHNSNKRVVEGGKI